MERECREISNSLNFINKNICTKVIEKTWMEESLREWVSGRGHSSMFLRIGEYY